MTIPNRAITQSRSHVSSGPLKPALCGWNTVATANQAAFRSGAAGRIWANSKFFVQGARERRGCVGLRLQARDWLFWPAARPARSFACCRAMFQGSTAAQEWEGPDSVLVTEFEKEACDGDVLAGSVTCQILREKDGLHLYIKSLEVDPAYRRAKVGTMLMEHCLVVARRDYNIVEAYLHVPTNEFGAIAFCQRYGFTIKGRLQDLYKGTDNPDCYVFSKKGGLWWDSHNLDSEAPASGTPFRPENVNLDLIEPGTVVAEFDKQVQWPGEDLAGSITCQVIRTADLWYHLYIKSLVVNERYRRNTVGSQLLKISLDFAVRKFKVVEAFAYVPTNDFQAKVFCEKSGFTIKAELPNFYKDTERAGCYIYSKDLLSKD